MIDPTQPPSRSRRHWIATALRWMLVVAAGAWVLLLTSAGVLHGFIVPRIGEYRGQVEQLASKALGAPVRIGALIARSDGWIPSVEVQDIAILDTQLRPVLHIPKAWVAVSVPSLWRLGVEQLVIEGPELDVRRLADGRWMVAGMLLEGESTGNHSAAQWLLRQPEVALRDGVVRWQDDVRGKAPQTLNAVEVTVHGGRRHQSFRFSGQAPSAGTTTAASDVVIMGRMREPLLALGAPWEHWKGEVFLQAAVHNLPDLPLPASWGVRHLHSQGNVRAWMDVDGGQFAGATVDVQMPEAQLDWLREDIEPLQLSHVAGRLDLRALQSGWSLAANGLHFALADGQPWPASDWQVQWPSAGSQLPYQLRSSHVDVAGVLQFAQRLPLPSQWAKPLAGWAAAGAVQDLSMQWDERGGLALAQTPFRVQGRLKDVTLLPVGDGAKRFPGIEQLSGSFVAHQQGGQANLQIRQGALSFPSVFEDARIPVDRLDLPVQWTHAPEGRWAVEVGNATFSNEDAAGQLRARWGMQDGEQPLPGRLFLEGELSRANGARVFRYLPLAVPKQARDYVRDSVRSGDAKNVQFKVDGALADFPFSHAQAGTFWIKAPVKNVVFDYVPERLRGKGEAAWPLMTQLSGDLVFVNEGMQVHKAQTSFGGSGRVKMGGIEASIPDLAHPVLDVSGVSHAPLSALMELVNASAIAPLTEHAMADMQTDGQAELQLKLHLPMDALQHSKVQGLVKLQGNRIRYRKDVPELQQAQGAVSFSESGFALQKVTAQALGGAVTLEGGLKVAAKTAHLSIEGQGTATVAAVAADGFLDGLSRLTPVARGETRYALRIGVEHGVPQVHVRTDLQGVRIDLPAPLGKEQMQSVPLDVRYQALPSTSETQTVHRALEVRFGEQALVAYAWNGVEGDAVRSGWLQFGGPLPSTEATKEKLMQLRSVQAQVAWTDLDLQAWLDQWEGASPAGASASQNLETSAYLPEQVRLEGQTLRFKGRSFHAIQATATRNGRSWSAQVHANEVAGRVAYEAANPQHPEGKFTARLDYLHVPGSTLAEQSQPASAPAAQVPALDIEVGELVLAQRPLGRWTVHARNQITANGSRWLLDQFDIALPEAVLRAHGEWAPGGQGYRRTRLQFGLELKDSGRLLERFAMPGVIRGGKGLLHGELSWRGSPLAPDWKGMEGGLKLDVGEGQFLKVEPGMAKLLSVLSLQSLPRRIGLDFRDVFSSGFAFDFVRGDVTVHKGMAKTNNLQMKGVNAAVLLEGQAALAEETQQLRVVVVPEINAMTASLVATAINPVVGLGSFLAQALLRGPLVAAGTREFEITGSWSDPVVRAVSRNEKMAVPEAAPSTPEKVQ